MLVLAADAQFDDLLSCEKPQSRFTNWLFSSNSSEENTKKERRKGPIQVGNHEIRRRPKASNRPSRKIGEVLIITDDLNLVLSMRQDLLALNYDLTWTNNFWIAMSYLRSRVFSSLILDLAVESVEESFVLHFLEEYEERSDGYKLFLKNNQTSALLERQIKDRGHKILSNPLSSDLLVGHLELEKAKNKEDE